MATTKTPPPTEEPVKSEEKEVQYPDAATRHYHEPQKKQKKEG